MPKVVTIRSIGALWLACVATSVISRRGFISIYSHSAELRPRRPTKVVNVTTDSLRLLSLHPSWRASPGALSYDSSRSHQEQNVKHDRLSERDGQNRLDQNLGCGTGITSHGVRGCHADQTNPN